MSNNNLFGFIATGAPSRTLELFRMLAEQRGMAGFVLIGGTALSIQIGHRLSEDLDFWWYGETLKESHLSDMLNALRQQGASIELTTNQKDITKAKINGYNLLDYVQEYLVNGVKVSFVARKDVPHQYFRSFIDGTIAKPELNFEIATRDTIFRMKSWLINTRAKSRDLFDLKTFIEIGKNVEDIFNEGVAADPAYSIESAKNVLTGVNPLDYDDEGFESIGVEETKEDIYAFFNNHIDEYEVSVTSIISGNGNKVKP